MLTTNIVNVVAIVGLIAIVASDEDEVSFHGPSGLRVHCSRRGARITVYRNVSNGTLTGKITVSFTELRELYENGSSVGGGGQSGGRGIYTAFDKQDFTISGPTDTTLAYSNQVNASCLTVMADLQDIAGATTFAGPTVARVTSAWANFTGSTVPGVTLAGATSAGPTVAGTTFTGATFAGQICAVKDNGMLFLGEENSTLSRGHLKFTVNVSNWKWETDGKYLQLKIHVKIPLGRVISEESHAGNGIRRRPKKFLIGGGAVANFSTQVNVDGTWHSMPTGFPMYEKRGADNYITIRIPRFTNYAEYDPSIDPGSSPESSDSKGSFVLPSVILPWILGLLMTLVIHV